MTTRRWADFSGAQKAGLVALASVQVSLAVAAWTDLAVRAPAEVRGGKGKWAAIIAVNFIGPVLYFTRGRTSD